MGCHTSVDESEKPGQQEEEIRKRKGQARGHARRDKTTEKQHEETKGNAIKR
jgi:hypothetical protein